MLKNIFKFYLQPREKWRNQYIPLIVNTGTVPFVHACNEDFDEV